MSPSTPGAEARYIDGTYLAEHSSWHEEDAPWKAEQVRRMIERHGLRPSSVCDVGCGTAGVLCHLAPNLPRTARLVGYEPSLDAMALAESRGKRIELVAADARKCEEQFDLVLMLDVFEHIEDYLGFLRAVRRNGRRFIFHIPLDLSVQCVLRMSPLMSARRQTGHLHYFSRETAVATLEDAGYAVVETTFTRGGIELPRSALATRIAALPRDLASRVAPAMAARVLGGFSLLVLAEPSTT